MFSNLTQHFRKKPAEAAFCFGLERATAQPEVGLSSDDPLFAPRIAPQLKSHLEQPRNGLAGFFSGLREAAERFAMTHIAPLVALNPAVCFQVRTVAVYVKPENDKLLRELQTLQPHIIKTAAVNCLKQSRVADQFDLSEFFGIIVVAGEEVASGEAVMTLATVGIERINIEFEFEGEHVSRGDEAVLEAAASSVDISLRLVHGDGRVEQVAATGFPLLVGTAPGAAIRVAGTYVSREHATLYFDHSLHRVVLQDHSRHGTWLNGKLLGADGRGVLHGTGQIRLAAGVSADAPVLEFSHTTIEQLEPTPLVGLQTPTTKANEFVATPRETPLVSAVEDATFREAVEPPTLPAMVPIFPQETMLAPVVELPNLLSLSPPIAETRLCETASLRALAWLQVRTQEGVSTLPVTELPFVIGREPKAVGFSVNGQASYVSREHLKLVSFHHKCFTIENGGLGRNNTYRKGVLQDNRFLYRPVPPASDGGWIVLGGHRLDGKCVEVRLLTACPVGAS